MYSKFVVIVKKCPVSGDADERKALKNFRKRMGKRLGTYKVNTDCWICKTSMNHILEEMAEVKEWATEIHNPVHIYIILGQHGTSDLM